MRPCDPVHTHNMGLARVGKRPNLTMGGIGHGTSGYTLTQAVDSSLDKYAGFLRTVEGVISRSGGYTESTIKNYVCYMRRLLGCVITDGHQTRCLRLCEVAAFNLVSEIDAFRPYYQISPEQTRINIDSAFVRLKEFSETEEGVACIADAEAASILVAE